MSNRVLCPKRPFFLPLLLLILITLGAFWLRVYHIDAFSFWSDEGLTPLRSGYAITEILSNRVTIQEGVTNDTHPALYYLLIHFTRQLFGETDFAYRFPSALLGVLLVPLLYRFGRRLNGRSAGIIAALLTAVNPLYIWYSNEARMYTLATLLLAGASLVLWRELEDVKSEKLKVKSMVLYGVLAGLALYTHYTAVFLIAAQSVFWLWLLWRRGQKRLIAATAVIALLIAIPLIPYTIPRLFKGVEYNFSLVSPRIMLLDVLRFFNLGLTVDFESLPIQLLTLFTFLLLLAGLWAARPWRKRLFLLTYLLAIVFGLMLGQFIKPMYQGARHIMLGSPAFILLVSMGATAVAVKSESVKSKKSTYHLSLITYHLPTILATAVLLLSAVHSLHNLYTNPQYAKDNLRQLIAFVEQNAGDGDIIVYNNAILLPLHDHYRARSDIAVTASPYYPSRAANTSAAQLSHIAELYDRIWLVTDPPTDERDANGLVRRWLDDHLTFGRNYPFPARTTEIEAIVYQTDRPHAAQPLDAQWPGWPRLTAVALTNQQPVDETAVWVQLTWDGQPPAANSRLRLTLLSPDDQTWAAVEPPFYDSDGAPLDWRQPVRLSYGLPLNSGTPPGNYRLQLQPLDGSGTAVAQPIIAQTIAISRPANAASERLFAANTAVHFQNGITLAGISTADVLVRPGHTLPVTLYWQSKQPLSNPQQFVYQIILRHSSGQELRRDQAHPGPDWLTAWPADTLIRQNIGLYFPADTAPGTYRMEWQLLDGDTAVPARPSWRPWHSQSVTAGKVDVLPWPLETDLPPMQHSTSAAFGDAITLQGYDLAPTASHLDLTLYWQTTAVPDNSYLVFVHLANAAGEIVSQQDKIPVDGLRPTSGWRPNEVLTDPYQLTLPADLPPGTYELRIGFFLPDNFVRLPVMVNGAPQPDNQLKLTTVTLP